jgi:hypothetical protein
MPTSEQLMIALSPWLTLVVWLPLAMLLAYFARRPVHSLIWTTTRSLRLAGRLLAVYCGRAGLLVQGWCGGLLLRQARNAAAWELRDAHQRLEARVRQELDTLPALRQRLGDQLSAMEEDFQRSTDTPPEPPNWGQVMDAVSRLGSEHSGAVARTLEDIRDSLAQYRADAREQQRRQHHRRYLLLYRMMPRWRRVQRVLEALDGRLGRLEHGLRLTRSRLVTYQRLQRSGSRRVLVLAASALGRFTVASMLLAMAAAAITVYVALVGEPMREILGADPVAPGLPAWAAIMILLLGLQLLFGVLMLDSQRISRVIPPLGALDGAARRGIFWLGFTVMLFLSASMAGLHYWMGIQTLAVGPMAVDSVSELVLMGVVGEAALAAALLLFPFLLAFAAVPLGMLGATVRPVIAMLLWFVLHVGMLLGRLLALLATVSGRVAVQVYDVFIAVPLWVEQYRSQRASSVQQAADMAVNERNAPPALAAVDITGRPGRTL